MTGPYEYQRSVDGKTWVDCSEVDRETQANTGFRYHRWRPAGAGDDRWWYITNFGTPLPFAERREEFLDGLRALFRDTGIVLRPEPGFDINDARVEIVDYADGCESMMTLVGDYQLSEDGVLTFLDARGLKDRERRTRAAEKRRAKRAEQKR